MNAIRNRLRTVCAEDRGATAVEYGLIAALIVVAMIGGLSTLGGGAGGMWGRVSNIVQNNM